MITARAFERSLLQILKCPLGHASPSGLNRSQFGLLHSTLTEVVEGPESRISSPFSRRWFRSRSSNPIQPWRHCPPNWQDAPSAEGQRTTGTPRRIASTRASCRSRNNRPDAASTSFAIIWFCKPGTAKPRTTAMMTSTMSVSTSEKPGLFRAHDKNRNRMKGTLPAHHPLGSDLRH